MARRTVRRKGRTMSDERTPEQLVDDLGFLKAEIAALTKKEDALKAKLASLGLSAIDGVYYRATVTTRKTTRLDNNKVKALLSVAQLTACSYETSSVVVSVGAPIRDSKAK